MAHHLAELMVSAKKASTVSAKRAIEADVCELIIKLWAHRGELQNHINPLAPLAPILGVIRTLDTDNHSWIPRHLSGDASSLYDVFRRLMIAALLGQAKMSGTTEVKQARGTTRFQSSDEKEVIAGLGIWSDTLSPQPKIRIRFVDSDQEDKADEAKSIDQLIRETIAETRSVLDKFEQGLERLQPGSGAKRGPVAKRKRSSARTG